MSTGCVDESGEVKVASARAEAAESSPVLLRSHSVSTSSMKGALSLHDSIMLCDQGTTLSCHLAFRPAAEPHCQSCR